MRNCPDWLKNSVIYNIYPQSFKDSNGDGIGDIPGIISKLDYISDMGFDVIWLNPIYPSPFGDAGYDVSDYCDVAPRYGTLDDVKTLIAQAAKRNIKVMLDFVPGHTSVEHPWFKKSCEASQNKYSNWYVWNSATFSESGPGFISGYAPRDAKYKTNFFWFQPALNYGYANPEKPWQLPVDHPDVLALKEEMKNAMRFWLDLGVAGFRVDMAASLVKNDPDHIEITKYWNQVRDWLEKDYPGRILLSEWSDPKVAIPAGFHLDFMIHAGTQTYNELFRMEPGSNVLPSNGHSYFRKDGKGDITCFLEDFMEHLSVTAGKGFICIPSGNHDLPRINMSRNIDELKTAYAFLLTMPGVPVIYYGDEIGMRNLPDLVSKEGGYNRTMARTPMQWDNSDNAGFSTGSPDSLYLPVDDAADRPTVSAQLGRENSLLEFIRTLISLRKSAPALCGNGSFVPLFAEKERYPFVYLRSDGKEEYLIAVNPADRQEQTDPVPALSGCTLKCIMGKDSILSDGKITMPPVSFSISRICR